MVEYLYMYHTHPVRHHPDIRWIVVITILVGGASMLLFYNLFAYIRPVPAAVQQVEQQRYYLEQANETIIQLQKINHELQAEIIAQQKTIDQLRAQTLSAPNTNKK